MIFFAKTIKEKKTLVARPAKHQPTIQFMLNLNGLVGFLFVVSELVFYLVICIYLYNHDQV